MQPLLAQNTKIMRENMLKMLMYATTIRCKWMSASKLTVLFPMTYKYILENHDGRLPMTYFYVFCWGFFFFAS